jgi:hypothetical protein
MFVVYHTDPTTTSSILLVFLILRADVQSGGPSALSPWRSFPQSSCPSLLALEKRWGRVGNLTLYLSSAERLVKVPYDVLDVLDAD